MISTRLYRSGTLEAADFDPELVSDYLGEPDTIVWLDVAEPSPGDLDLLAQEFRLHPLAIEDATKPHQRPKVERYEHHLFIVTYAVRAEGSELETAEVDAFLGDRFLITVRKDARWSMEPVLQRWDAGADLTKHGVGYLLYGLLDVVVDGYFVVVDDLNDRIEDLEESVFEPERAPGVHEELFRLRKALVQFRRVVLPLREVLNTLLRRDLRVFSEDILPYFQDVYDHVLRVSESAEAMRELLASALEVNLSVTSNRLNDIMKKVTSWAAIIGAGTLIAGVYGMNFRLIPRDQTLAGFWFALGMMILSAVGLYVYFRRKDWL